MAPQPSDPLLAVAEKLQAAENQRRSRNLDDAKRACEEILAHYPDYVAALHTLGLVLAGQNDHAGALTPLAKAAMLCPVDWRLLTALSATNLRLRNTGAALLNLEQAEKLSPDNPDILLLFGEAHRQERDYLSAASTFRHCLALDPSATEARRLLADCLSQIGQFEDAAALFKQILEEGKAGITTVGLLCNMPYGMVDFDVLSALEGAERQKTTLNHERAEALAAFVRGWIFDGQGNHAEAWKHLVLANAMKWQAGPGEYAKDANSRQNLLAAAKALAGKPVLAASNPDLPVSLFITGPSRSGKTTLERLVGLLPQTRRGYETAIVEQAVREATQLAGTVTRTVINGLPPHLDGMFAERYNKALSHRAREARLFTNTHPGRLKDVIRLSAAIPNCRFVFMRRQPDDLAFRIFQKNYLEGNHYAYDLSAIREYLDWYFEYITVLHSRYPSTTLILDYETMIDAPRAALSSVAALCGLAAPTMEMPALGDDRDCSRPYLDKMRAPL